MHGLIFEGMACRVHTIKDLFKFTITADGGSWTATAMNNEIVWKWSWKYGFPIKNIETQLRFVDSSREQLDDFTRLYEFERSRERCMKIELEVDINTGDVENPNWEHFYEGQFRVTSCRWNVSDLEVLVKVDENDAYSCIIENWEKRFNIIDYATPVTLQAYLGERRVVECTKSFYANQRISPRIGNNYQEYLVASDCDFVEFSTFIKTTWDITRLDNQGNPVEYEGPRTSGSGTPVVPDRRPDEPGTPRPRLPLRINDQFFGFVEIYPWHYEITTTYAYDFVDDATQPPGNGWVSYDGGWARPSIVHTYIDEDGNVITEPMFINGLEGSYSFNDVVKNALAEYCPNTSLVSNFYGINSDNSNPDNKYYQRAAEDDEMKELYITPKSNIIEYGEANLATNIYDKRQEEGYTFKDFLQDLEHLHDVLLRFVDGTWYLEHRSYFKKTYRINLTEEKYEWDLKGKWQYEYQNIKMPQSEKWQMMDITDKNGDFDRNTIEYENCLYDDNREKTYQLTAVTTNIEALYIDGFRESPEYSKDGIAIISTKDLVVNQEIGEVTGQPRLNGNMAMPRLIHRYKTYLRPFHEGLWNRIILHMDHKWKVREIDNQVCLSAEDAIDFQLDDFVKTQLGWGYIEEAEWKTPDGILTITTQHD